MGNRSRLQTTYQLLFIFFIHLFFQLPLFGFRSLVDPKQTPTPSRWTQESLQNKTILFIDGEIQEIQWSELKYGAYKNVHTIVLNSYGGSVDGAIELAKVVRERQIHTIIPANGVCMSACTLIFQAGIQRSAHTSSLFMYHSPRLGLVGQAQLETLCKKEGSEYCQNKILEYEKQAQTNTQNFFNQYMDLGLSEKLFELIKELPEQPRQQALKEGNWFKKVDLVFANDSNDPRILQRLISPKILSLNEMDQYNIVTDWFDKKPPIPLSLHPALNSEESPSPPLP